MSYDFSQILDLNTVQCSLITAILYISPLSKRQNFLPRIMAGILMILFCAPLLKIYNTWSASLFPDIFSLHSSLYIISHIAIETLGGVFFLLLLLSGLFFFCCDIKPFSALCGAFYAYITQDIAYTLFTLLIPEGMHRGQYGPSLPYIWFELLIMILLYGTCYFFFSKKIIINGEFPFYSSYSLLIILIVLCGGKLLGSYVRFRYAYHNTHLFQCLLAYDIFLSSALLLLQMFSQREYYFRTNAELEMQLREQQQRQYEIFHSNIENINHKCHDLKYLIAALKQENDLPQKENLMEELERSVMIYDSYMRTGNQSLDTILTNTWLRCENKKIQWTCMADGMAISFIEPLDLYILLGNAFDNAIECLSKISDPDYRFLSVNIHKKDYLAFIKIENYCEQEVQFKDGLPVTTKKNHSEHGFGEKSIASVINQYNGEFRMSFKDHIFSLDIMLPIPH